MGGGFTLLPTLLPWAQLGRGKLSRPVRAPSSACLSKSANIEIAKNLILGDLEAVLAPIKGPLGLHFWLPTASSIQSMLDPSANTTTKKRQPRDTVNIGSRSTCAVCVSHGTCLENRCRDLSMLCLLGTFLAIRLKSATKTPLEDDFLRKS